MLPPGGPSLKVLEAAADDPPGYGVDPELEFLQGVLRGVGSTITH
jgi:hypothetical protein